MAKVISDEIMKLKIIVNGDEGQKEILDLERANKTLGLRIKDLTDKQKELSKQRKQDSAEYKANKLEIEKLSTAIADNKKKIDDQIKSMDNSRLTMEQLRKKASDLKLVMNNMNPNSESFRNVQNNLRDVETRMLELRNGARASGSSISNLADKFNQYSGILTATVATMAGVALSVQSVIDYNNKLVDAQTMVGKATGMTNEEVKELTKSFSEFRTRTSSMDLLKIAEVGGKLGVPKEQIKEFTQEVDKAYVALGDNFTGGVEAVANKLGKLKGIFKETKDLNVADAINKIGSSLNELDNQGTASADNVSEFALRVGTLPEKLKPTIAETLGLGAAFEESGINAERASSGYNKFVRVAATEADKFAKVMGVTTKEVKDLINQDPLQFFLKFAEGAKGLDATQISEMLKFLNLNDAEVISVLGSATENTDRFRKSIETSNQALKEGTSLTDEFNRVNTNTAAIFDKVKKTIVGAFSSETIAKALNWMISIFAKFIGATEDADGTVTGFKNTLIALIKIITVAIASTISYNLFLGTYNALLTTTIQRVTALNLVEKLKNATSAIGNTIRSAYNAVTGVAMFLTAQFTRSLTLQTAAQERLNLVTKANPWGALLSVVIAVGSAYLLFRQETEKTVNAKKKLNEVMAEGVKNAASEVTELDLLYKKATNVKLSMEERTAAIQKLKKEYPEYFGNIKDEIILNGKAKDSYLELRDAIIASARAEAAKDELKKRAADRLKRDEEIQAKIDEEKSIRDNYKARIARGDNTTIQSTQGFQGSSINTRFNNQDLLENSRNRIKNLQQTLINNKNADALEDKYYTDQILADEKRSQKLNKGKESNLTTSTYNTNFGTEKSSKSKSTKSPTERQQENMLKEGDKAIDLAIQIELQKQDALASLQDDWYQKELSEIIAQENRKMAEIDKLYKSPEEIKKLEDIIAISSGTSKAQLQKTKEQWIANNKELDALKGITRDTTFKKIQALDEKQANEELKKQDENLKKKLALLQREENETIAKYNTIEEQKAFLQGKISNDELSKIKTWNDGKQAIQKYYQEQSLILQSEYLQQLVDELEKIPADVITPEQKKNLEEYKNLIAKTAKEKAELKNGTSNDNKSKVNFSSLGGETDILGLNEEQWKAMFAKTDKFADNIKKVGAAIQVAQQMYAQYYAFQQANMQAELRRYEVNSDRRKKRLEFELKTGLINQETYKKLTLEADAELDKKKAEMEYKTAKRQRAMQIAQTIANTAMAIMSIYSTGGGTRYADFGVYANILAGVVGAIGALQVATILRQPLPEVPGAEDGYYPTMRQQDGKMFNAKRRTLQSGLYSEPTVLVGEGNKTELVVDNRTLKRINPVIQQEYMQEIQRVKGFESGMLPSGTSSTSSDEILIKAMMVLDEVRLELSELRKYGVIARWENLYKAVDQIDQTREERQRIIDKNKR